MTSSRPPLAFISTWLNTINKPCAVVFVVSVKQFKVIISQEFIFKVRTLFDQEGQDQSVLKHT